MEILDRNGNGHMQNPLWNASQMALVVPGEAVEIVEWQASSAAPPNFQVMEGHIMVGRLLTGARISKACSFSKVF
jgi:hypothetical protein